MKNTGTGKKMKKMKKRSYDNVCFGLAGKTIPNFKPSFCLESRKILTIWAIYFSTRGHGEKEEKPSPSIT